MTFLMVLLKILKILGLTIAGILALILVVLLLVLFYPVRYKGKICYKDNNPDIDLRFSYLFSLIRGKYILNKDTKVFDYVIISRRLFGKNKKHKRKKAHRTKAKKASSGSSNRRSTAMAEGSTDSAHKKTAAAYSDAVQNKSVDTHAISVNTETQSKHNKNTIFRKIKAFFDKVKNIVRNFRTKFNCIRKEYNDKNNREGFDFGIKVIKKLIKHILPKKHSIEMTFGTGDPATTGEILGVFYSIGAMFGLNLIITPEFEEKKFELCTYIKGRIFVFVVLIWAIKAFRHKKLRALIDKISNLI